MHIEPREISGVSDLSLNVSGFHPNASIPFFMRESQDDSHCGLGLGFEDTGEGGII